MDLLFATSLDSVSWFVLPPASLQSCGSPFGTACGRSQNCRDDSRDAGGRATQEAKAEQFWTASAGLRSRWATGK